MILKTRKDDNDMSDKEHDIDDILEDLKLEDISDDSKSDVPVDIDEKDKNNETVTEIKETEDNADNDNIKKAAENPEKSDKSNYVKPLIKEGNGVSKQNRNIKREERPSVSRNNVNRNNKRPVNKNSNRPKNASSVNGKKKKRHKKKNQSKVNTSIFGGIIVTMVVLTVSMIIAVSGITIVMEYWGIGRSDNDVSFNIPQNATNDEIADILFKNGIIDNKKLFKLAIKIEKPNALYPGDITLQPSMGYSDIIEKISQMRETIKTTSVTFTEGENLLEIAKKLEKAGVCTADDFLFEFNKNQDYSFEKDLDKNDTFYRMEGYFFPDTYEFYTQSDTYSSEDAAFNVTKTVRENFNTKISDDLADEIKKSNMSLNEIITLASIVQMEANSVEEMPKVASVFINRLNDPETYPMLQSDTTDKYIKNVIKKQAGNQTQVEHFVEKYDTYSCEGLPSGPICNPGADAIRAVLDPEKTEYYYFCNNLKTGKSYYAKTLKDHEKNLKKAGLTK